MTVHRPVDEGDLRLGLQGAVFRPFLIVADDVLGLAPPDQAVRRRHDADRDAAQLGDRIQDAGAVVGDDVGVIAERLFLVKTEVRAFLIENPPAQRPVAAEGVAREEDLVLHGVGHDRFRPVHERRRKKLQGAAPQAERVALAHHPDAVAERVEPREHLPRPGRADDLHPRRQPPESLEQPGVVGLHVVDYEIIDPRQPAHLLELREILVGLGRGGQVDDRPFLVGDQVGIIGHPLLGDRPEAFKKVGRPVVDADPEDIRTDLSRRHDLTLLVGNWQAAQHHS